MSDLTARVPLETRSLVVELLAEFDRLGDRIEELEAALHNRNQRLEILRSALSEISQLPVLVRTEPPWKRIARRALKGDDAGT